MLNGGVSFWWNQIGMPDARSALGGDVSVDVAIVGGGYTGLWTAYYLAKADPSLRIAIVEQHFAGFGASGRNGGWLTNTITGGREQYLARFGREAVGAFQSELNATVREVIRVAAAEGIDADIVSGGEYTVARNAAQQARLEAWASDEASWPMTDTVLLDAQEARERITLEGTTGALWHPHAARIQPAKLARGLAAVVERLGVRIYESTTANELRPGSVITDGGVVRADVVVRATEGFTANLAGLKREWLPMNSSLVVTEPIPLDLWKSIGWGGRELVSDMAHSYFYAQRTADDRIAIGGRGVPYRFGSRTDNAGDTAARTAASLKRLLTGLLPMTENVPLAHSWSGVLGVPRDWSATVGFDAQTKMAWAGGYVGTGVTSTNLAGRTLTDLITGRKSSLTALPWVNHRVRRWEFEPLRWVAVHSLYAAYRAADASESRGGSGTSPIATIADRVSGRSH